jgi:hypothetical protein
MATRVTGIRAGLGRKPASNLVENTPEQDQSKWKQPDSVAAIEALPIMRFCEENRMP